jgi:hypothetical protein
VRFWQPRSRNGITLAGVIAAGVSGAAEENSIRFSHFSWWLPSMCVFIEDLVGLKAHNEDSPTQGEASAVLVFCQGRFWEIC